MKEAFDQKVEKILTDSPLNHSQNNLINKEEYDARITELENKIAELEKELLVSKRNTYIDTALIKAGAKNPIAVRALMDTEKLAFDLEGKISGLDAIIDEIKSQEPYLFYPPQKKGVYGDSLEESWRDDEFDPFLQGFNKR